MNIEEIESAVCEHGKKPYGWKLESGKWQAALGCECWYEIFDNEEQAQEAFAKSWANVRNKKATGSP